MITLIFIVFVLVAAFSFIEDNATDYKDIVYIGIMFLLICIAGFRPIGCDNDSLNYEYFYFNADSEEVATFVEKSYIWLSLLFHKVFDFDSVRPLLLLYAILGVSLKIAAIRRYSDIWFCCILIYMGYYFILHDMTQIRASIASGIFLLSLKPLVEKRRWTFFFMMCVALFFHYSALVLFPLIFMGNSELKKIHRILLATLVPVGYIIYFLHIDIITAIPLPYIGDKIEIYKDLNEKGILGDEINVFNMVFLVEILIYFFLLIKYELIVEYNKYLPIMLKIMGFSIFSFLLFSSLPVLAFRTHELYGIVDIILFTNIYYVIRPRWISNIVVLIIGLSLLCISLFYADLLVLN